MIIYDSSVLFKLSDFFHAPEVMLPYLITCPINLGDRLPIAVSLTENPCEYAENKATVIDNQPIDGIKKSFGFCSKFMFFDDRNQTTRFIEWVSMMRILGVDKITLFNHHVHSDHFKILNYYRDQGFIEYFDYLEPSGIPYGDNNFRLRQREMIEVLLLTDCFYKTRNL